MPKKPLVLLLICLLAACVLDCSKKAENAEVTQEETNPGTDENTSVKSAGVQPEIAVFPMLGHGNKRVYSTAFSPDGSKALTASESGLINVIDVATGRIDRIRIWPDEGLGSIVSLEMNRHNSVILAALSNGEIKLYSVGNSGFERVLLTISAYVLDKKDELFNQYYYPAMYSPDFSMILGKSGDKIILWDAYTGAVIREMENTSWDTVPAAFSPDGSMILVRENNSLKLYDTAAGRRLRTLFEHPYTVTSAAFSSDGTRIISASYDRTIRLWDTAEGRQIKSFSGQPNSITSVTFASGDEHILFVSEDGFITLFDISAGAEVKSGYTMSEISSAAFSPDGSMVLTGTRKGIIDLFNFNDSMEIRSFSFGSRPVASVEFSSDGRRIAAARTRPGDLKIWDIDTGERISITLNWGRAGADGMIIDRGGNRILSINTSYGAKLWDTVTGNEIKTYPINVYMAMFSPDGRQIVTFDNEQIVRIYDADTGNEIRTFEGFFYAYSHDCRKMLAQMYRGSNKVEILDVVTGAKSASFERFPKNPNVIAFSPDGSCLLTEEYLWDTATGERINTFRESGDEISAVAFSPDGKWILTGTKGGTARLWDIASGDEVCEFRWLVNSVNSADFSPDGKWIALGGNYERVMVINIERYIVRAKRMAELEERISTWGEK
jgi:WD40 repeat protein